MANKMVHLRIPAELYLQSQTVVKERGFASIQEFMRNAMRNDIEEIRMERIVERLKELKGSVKHVKRLSKAERDVLAEKWIKENPSEILRKFGRD